MIITKTEYILRDYALQKDRFFVIDFHLREKVRQLVSNNKIGDMAEISTFFSSSIAVPAQLKLPISTRRFQKTVAQTVHHFSKSCFKWS